MTAPTAPRQALELLAEARAYTKKSPNWRGSPLERVLAELESALRAQAEADRWLREKAALWDALMGSSRVRVLGSAGLDLDTREVAANGYAHLCMEIWTIYGWDVVKDPEMIARERASHDRSVAYLELYARTALHRAALAQAGDPQ